MSSRYSPEGHVVCLRGDGTNGRQYGAEVEGYQALNHAVALPHQAVVSGSGTLGVGAYLR